MKFSTQKFAQLIIFLYLCAVNDANDENMQYNHSIHLTYSRTSVCAADDYINKSLDIRMPPSATLAHLVDYLLHYHEDYGYAAIPFTGGNAEWKIMSGDTPLVKVTDDGQIISFCDIDPRTPISQLLSSHLRAERI